MLMKTSRSMIVLALTAGCLLGAGCSDSVTASRVTAATPEPTTATSNPTTGGSAELQAIVNESHGKVVLIDFWATWCGPCRKQFAHTVKLHQLHAKDGLVVVSVSMDDKEEAADVAEFLKSQGAAFRNLISHDGGSQQAYDDFQIPSLPHYVIFDRTGQRHDLTSDDPEKPLTTESLDQKVANFLSQQPLR